MTVWVVFEYAEYGNRLVGIYKEREHAIKKHQESPVWRYVEEYEVKV